MAEEEVWDGNLNGYCYKIGQRHRVIGDETTKAIVYFEGKLKHPSGFKEDVCFLRAGSFDECQDIIQFSCDVSRHSIANQALMTPKFMIFGAKQRSYLVCFEAFIVFPGEGLRSKLPEGNTLNTILGCPHQTRDAIIGLANTFEGMIKANVTSSLLGLNICYVWCQNSSSIKFLKMDRSMNDYSNGQVEIQINHFKESVRKYIFDPSYHYDPQTDRFDHCEMKNQFLESFTQHYVRILKRMTLVRGHPYLRNKARDILAYFAAVSEAVVAKDKFEERCTFRYKNNISWYSHIFIQNGTWSRPYWKQQFDNFRNGGKYSPSDMMHLLRFVRNMYVHRKDMKLSLEQILFEVIRVWPEFLGIYYEALYM